MLDTVRVFTKIDKKIFLKIKSSSVTSCKFRANTQEIFYEISSDNLKGSYDSSLFVRADTGEKYGLDKDYILIVEGSCHKLVWGQNAYKGFYDLEVVVCILKEFVENAYDIKLPSYDHWFLQRVDISKCFDLLTQTRVINYINSLSNLDFPRRNLKYYKDSCLYFTGTTTTLKIYNKFLEYKVHDKSKLLKTDFDVEDFENKVKGFVRFEVEIKKKKLQSMFEKKYTAKMKNLYCKDFDYEMFEKIWCDEFMKVLKVNYTDLKKVSNKVSVKNRIYKNYDNNYANSLYNFYLSLVIDGCKSVRNNTSKSTYYRKIKELKNLGIDFTSNKISIVYSNKSDFIDIFEMKEVV